MAAVRTASPAKASSQLPNVRFDVRIKDALHLNEIAPVRAGLLAELFPAAAVTRHNAEAIADRLPDCRPTVVLMNPPFSATPGVGRIRHDADLRHLRAANCRRR